MAIKLWKRFWNLKLWRGNFLGLPVRNQLKFGFAVASKTTLLCQQNSSFVFLILCCGVGQFLASFWLMRGGC